MFKTLIITLLFSTTYSFGSTEEVIITHADTYNGYATIAGHLKTIPDRALGITVTNGGIKSSTITAKDGSWSIVIRQRSYNFSVESWELASPEERSNIVNGTISSN